MLEMVGEEKFTATSARNNFYLGNPNTLKKLGKSETSKAFDMVSSFMMLSTIVGSCRKGEDIHWKRKWGPQTRYRNSFHPVLDVCTCMP